MGRERGPGARCLETKEEAAEPTQPAPAGGAAQGTEAACLRVWPHSNSENTCSCGFSATGKNLSRRGLGNSGAELQGPDAGLGPSSRPPISGHPLGQSLRVLLSQLPQTSPCLPDREPNGFQGAGGAHHGDVLAPRGPPHSTSGSLTDGGASAHTGDPGRTHVGSGEAGADPTGRGGASTLL